jgi:hypothetical protein
MHFTNFARPQRIRPRIALLTSGALVAAMFMAPPSVAAPKGFCAVAVDRTESTLGSDAGEDAAFNRYSKSVRIFARACAEKKYDLIVYPISSHGIGGTEPFRAPFSDANKEARDRLVSAAVNYVGDLEVDTDKTTDVISTLGAISIDLRSRAADVPSYVLLLTDGIQTETYNMLLTSKPTKKFFSALLAKVRDGNGVHTFPEKTNIVFEGFAQSENPKIKQTALGAFPKLLEEFWVAYFAESRMKSKVQFRTTVSGKVLG